MSCHLNTAYIYHVRRKKHGNFFFLFGLSCLSWHGYRERFYCRISYFRDCFAAYQHGIFVTLYFGTFKNITCIPNYRLSDVFRWKICKMLLSTGTLYRSYLPQNQINFEHTDSCNVRSLDFVSFLTNHLKNFGLE